jgi:hypothetical protein
VAPDAISAHDVSAKIFDDFVPQQDFSKKGALCAVLLLGALAHLV